MSSVPQVAAQSSEPPGFAGEPGEWIARERELRLVLPDRAGFSEVESRDWLALENRGARASLRLRLSRAPRLVSPNECLAEARLRDPRLVPLADEEVIERRELVAPAHYDGDIVLGVREVGPRLYGFALAKGSAIGRCYVAVFETVASGPGRERVIASRLRAITQSLDSVEVPSVEDRLGR